MHKLKRFGALLLCLLTATALLPQALAAGTINVTRDSSLTISYTDSSTPLVGAQFAVYRVAAVSPYGAYTLTGDYIDCPFDLNSLSSGTASAVEGYVLLNDITPTATGTTNVQGSLSFSDLSPGLYLILGTSHQQNGMIYSTTPFFAALPTLNYSTNDWNYNAVVSPKHSEKPVPPPNKDGFVERKVLKVWDDDGFEGDRPSQIVVHLLLEGEIYDTVILSMENNWSHSWSKLDEKAVWSIVEMVPDGYTMEAEWVGITYVITNKKTATPIPEPTPTPTPDDTPTLPQTGQLWWPVPVLAAAGLLLLLIGCIRRRGANDEE